MKNKVIFIISILVAIILLSITIFNRGAEQQPPIGGDRDENGCLGPAGYSWSSSLELCVREWTLANCSAESRTADSCIALYEPVCGIDSQGNKQNYSNNCFACLNTSIEKYVDAEKCQ